MFGNDKNQGRGEFAGGLQPNNDFKFNKISPDSEFQLMISRDQEEIYKKLSEENQDLKDCLKQLQREMLDVVSLKQDIFTKRFKAEYGASKEPAETEEALKHQLELIRDDLFNSSFEETGKELIAKFKFNFQRLREFMDAVDKEISSMSLFN